jgi:hypothetical protein
MKTNILIIAAIVPIILTVLVFWVFDNGTYSKYYEGIMIRHFSEDDLQVVLNETNSRKTNAVKITDEDLNQVPKIKPLIQGIGTRLDTFDMMTPGMSKSELAQYKEWIEEKGISEAGLFEYDSQFYRIGFWIE